MVPVADHSSSSISGRMDTGHWTAVTTLTKLRLDEGEGGERGVGGRGGGGGGGAVQLFSYKSL